MKTTIGVGVIAAVILIALLVVEGPFSGDDPAPRAREPVATDPTVPRVVLRMGDDGAGSSDCLALAGGAASNSRLMAKRQQSDVRSFFGSLEELGFDKLQRTLVADLAGLDPFSIELRRNSPREPSYAKDLLPPPGTTDVGLTTQRRLDKALSNPGLDGWIREVQHDPTVLRHRWPGAVVSEDLSLRTWHTSVLGHALRTRSTEIQAHLHELPEGSFGLHELAVAIEVGMPTDGFLEALDRSDADPGESWSHHRLPRDVNLSVVAVFNARPGILRALLARGVEPSSNGHSVLDEVAVSSAIARGPMADVARQLAGVNDQPFFPSTIATFKRRFPMIPELVLHPDSVAALATSGVGGAVERAASMSGRWEEKVAEARRVEERCLDIWLDAADVPLPSLAAKLRHEERLRQELDEVLKTGTQQAEALLEDADRAFLVSIDLLREALDEALMDNEWSEILSLADEAFATFPFPDGVVDHETYYLYFLRTALDWGAPMDVVRALVDRTGGALPPDVIMTLVGSRNGSVAFAEELESLFGLDVHFVNDNGRNAVSEAVADFRTYTGAGLSSADQRTMRWLDYLMSRSVTTKPSRFGLDPLDTVLLAILENPAAAPVGVGVARLLIDNGAPIEPSHRQLVEQIRTADYDRFELLVDSIPALSRS